MEEEEIVELWKQGLNKYKLAEKYKRRYNQQVSIIRLDPKHRHSGRFISSYEALRYIERILFNYIGRNK